MGVRRGGGRKGAPVSKAGADSGGGHRGTGPL